MKERILRHLRENGGFVSGQELCDELMVSRTAVWKVIHQLQEEGYQIEAVRNKGYHLLDHADILSQAELSACLKDAGVLSEAVYCKEVDSTNNYARQLAEQGAGHGTVVVAETQTAGKGRRGRGWVSPAGSAIYMSCILRPPIEPFQASALTLVAAMAVERAISGMLDVRPLIKWPNDLIIEGRKICGILTEMSSDMDGIHYVVVGIGINANQMTFPEEIQQVATSLALASGKKVRRAALVAAIMNDLENYYQSFIKTADMSLLAESYNQKLVNCSKPVAVIEPAGTWMGRALGINAQGELMVEQEDGRIKNVLSGEVSVRGVYGYV